MGISLCKARTEANLKKNATHTSGNLTKTKQKQLKNPFSIIRSHFTAMNLLVTTDILEQLKMGRKA